MPKVEQISTASSRPRDEAATLRILNAFAVDVMSIPTSEDLFWYVAQQVVGRLRFIDCVIYTANQEQTELTQAAALGEKNPFGRNIVNPLKIPFGRGITGTVAETRQALIIDDLQTDPDYILDTKLARSEICVPIVSRGRILGVIDSEHPEAYAFGDAELEIMTTIAAMTSAKLELLMESDRSNQRYKELVKSHAQLAEETSNRRILEAKLYEAKKLEAVGRLSGRFAHEFNNALTVISGNLELAQLYLGSPEVPSFLGEAEYAAKRGAELISSMLSFSQRAHLKQQAVDLNDVVISTSQYGLLPELVSLELKLASELWPISADPDATKDALKQLISNACDALNGQGLLLISTENIRHDWSRSPNGIRELTPGCYVSLRVEDHGVGIPEERMSQIFDPFFTTKPSGKYYGMGLSSVIGYMKQIGGTVAVTSKLGQGSSFDLLFPVSRPPIKPRTVL